MNNHKSLTYINVQTNCNLSFSLLTIEKLINYSITSGVSSLALCEHNPYEFLKFYYLCKESGIKPVWGFKRVVNYNGQQLIANFFPRKYSEYKKLNQFFYEQAKEVFIDETSLGKIAPQCLLVLEVRGHEEISLITKLRLEILQYPNKENSLDVYLGLNFFPSEIGTITKNNVQMDVLPFFSVKSFNWNDHHLLDKLRRTSLVNGFTDVFLKSIPFLSRADLADHFGSHLVESSTGKSSAEFINHLFLNLEKFLSKINLFIRKNSSTDEGEKFKLLKQQCEKELNLLINDEKKLSYSEILEKELEIVKEKNYANYFLELAKIVKIFLVNQIEVGPGRGSATSSLIAYLLNLTMVDPVQNQLFFWRFLNEKRIDFPDIDIDVENQEAALHLVEEAYGRQSIAKLIVKKKIGWHTAVIASLKIFNVEEKDSIFIEENILRFLNFQENKYSSLKISYFFEKYHEAFIFARSIYSLYSGIAPHPSGIIISNKKLSEKLPVKNEKRGLPLCLYQQRYLANLGFKKFDFLSLTESLSFIKYIKKKNQSEVPSYMKLDMDDHKTWSLLKNCLLAGIFQINTKSFSEIINIFQPANFAELLLVISFNRPGASISLRELSQIRSFAEGGKAKQLESKKINEILSPTYGRIIFEEQISQILSYCLTVDFGEAELLRRSLKIIISDSEERRKFKLEFISKTTGKLKSFEKDILWRKIVESVPYLFNKAHATSYTYITYYTAYLKANFFTDALSYFLHRSAGNYKLITFLAEEAVLMKYKLETPSINTSLWEWKVDVGRGNILVVGFSQLGRDCHSFFEKVIEERSRNGIFRDWKDLLTRLPQHFGNLEASDLVKWIELGLFRSLPGDQQWVIIHLASFKRYARIISSLESPLIECLPFLLLPNENHSELSLIQENQQQYESFGFYPSYLNRWEGFSTSKLHQVREQLLILSSNYKQSENSENGEVKIHSILTSIKKLGNQYLLTLLLFNFPLEVLCNPDFYEKNFSLLKIHNEAVFTIESRSGGFKNSLLINNITAFKS